MRSRQTTWMAGGLALIASGVVGILSSGGVGTIQVTSMKVTSDLVYAVATAILAFGTSRAASVVGRSAPGIVCMLLMAAWPFVQLALQPLTASPDGTGIGIIDYLTLVVPTGAGAISAVEIVRRRTVPSPWRWAPTWALGLQVAIWVFTQIGGIALKPVDAQGFVAAVYPLGLLSFLSGTVGLGTIAVYLAARQRTPTVQIYRSSS